MEAKAGDISVPLAVLLKREMSNEKCEKPDLLYGEACQKKKGEDFTLLSADSERMQETGTESFSVFAVPTPLSLSLSTLLVIVLSWYGLRSIPATCW